jgi:solute carrier family 13 (sodium-dependent dicarboxylate transporter), member 2/3/5
MVTQYKNQLLILLGILVSIFLYIINPFTLESDANIVSCVALLMVFLWVSDALPMPVVAIIPLVLFPLLKINTIEHTAKSYANPVIFLFFGGFMLGLAIEKWNLHKRIAINIISKTGTEGNKIVLGFIISTGLLSMWLSNTATTMMMYPIALSVIAVVGQHKQENANYAFFNLTLMLAIAYSANIGGIATIIGTPPNVAYVGYFQNKYHQNINFTDWMLVCTPIALLLLGALYIVMVKWLYPSHIKSSDTFEAMLSHEKSSLGSMSVPEKRVLVVFLLTATLWIFRSLINEIQPWFKLDDTIIAVISAILLFIIPSGVKNGDQEEKALLEWSDTSKMAWGILLLFGGGISLAEALENEGIITIIGNWLGQNTSNLFTLILLITVLSIFISEVMSNVAQVIVFSPVVSAMAENMGFDPILAGIPMTLAASCAGMLPMGTPPNAIVFASNHIIMKDMIKVGLVMNLISIILITLFSYYVAPMVF